jgi:hypothetical protein
MHIGKRLNAPFNRAFESVNRFGSRKLNGRLNRCKDILGSVLSFPSEHSDVLVVPLSLRDVPCYFGRTYNLALSISDRRDRLRNVYQATILALADGFVMIDALPAPDASKDLRFLLVPLGWTENCNGLADGFFGGIAKDPLCGFVPT